jgi:hypothetical protein
MSKYPNLKNWTLWNCYCDCGNSKAIDQIRLVKGRVLSCGCGKGKWNDGENSRFAKLTKEKVIEIREKYKKGTKARELSTQYEVSTMTIYQIVNKKTWKNV